MADQRQRSRLVGRGLGWWCPFVTPGTAYPQVAAVNSFPSQDAVSHGVNSISSCPSSPPAHFPSPPEEEFTMCASGAPSAMQEKPGPQPYLICTTCNAMTKLWFTGCAVSTPKTSLQLARSYGEDAAWRSGKALHSRWLRWHCHVESSNDCLKKIQKLNPAGDCDHGHPYKILHRSDWHGLSSTGSNWYQPFRQDSLEW